MPDTKQDPRDMGLAVLVSVLLTPFTGMVRALAFRLLWDWFLSPQYGEGPTLRAWFGIGVLWSLFSRGFGSEDPADKRPIVQAIQRVLTSLLVLGAAVAVAAFARAIWGWG